MKAINEQPHQSKRRSAFQGSRADRYERVDLGFGSFLQRQIVALIDVVVEAESEEDARVRAMEDLTYHIVPYSDVDEC